MQQRELEPSASVPAFFGSELRRYRKAAGLTQEELGERINYTGALIGMIETTLRTPTLQFAEMCDRVMDTDGLLTRLWPLVNKTIYPSWFQGYVELEATATAIFSFNPQNVPGLLQTEDYARTLLQACWSEDVEQRVAARLERQKLLGPPPSTLVWAILDESVLRRPIGGRDVLREQLKHLAELATSRRIVLQVLPFSVGAHACSDGMMNLLSFKDGPDLVYVEGLGSGHLITEPNEVESCRLRYDLAKAAALSPVASVELIKAIMEEQ
jgi:transcriptional regulator with XRE-family HTH domain